MTCNINLYEYSMSNLKSGTLVYGYNNLITCTNTGLILKLHNKKAFHAQSEFVQKIPYQDIVRWEVFQNDFDNIGIITKSHYFYLNIQTSEKEHINALIDYYHNNESVSIWKCMSIFLFHYNDIRFRGMLFKLVQILQKYCGNPSNLTEHQFKNTL